LFVLLASRYDSSGTESNQMLSTSVPIRREASQGETTTGAADIQGEVVPPQMGPPEHLHARSDAGFLVVKRRHTGKDDQGALSLSGSTRLPPVSPRGECPSSTGSTLAGKDGGKHGRVPLDAK
jgi:hypothetical protein